MKVAGIILIFARLRDRRETPWQSHKSKHPTPHWHEKFASIRVNSKLESERTELLCLRYPGTHAQHGYAMTAGTQASLQYEFAERACLDPRRFPLAVASGSFTYRMTGGKGNAPRKRAARL